MNTFKETLNDITTTSKVGVRYKWGEWKYTLMYESKDKEVKAAIKRLNHPENAGAWLISSTFLHENDAFLVKESIDPCFWQIEKRTNVMSLAQCLAELEEASDERVWKTALMNGFHELLLDEFLPAGYKKDVNLMWQEFNKECGAVLPRTLDFLKLAHGLYIASSVTKLADESNARRAEIQKKILEQSQIGALSKGRKRSL